MRLKKAVAIIGSIIILLIVFMIYCAKDLTDFPNKKYALGSEDFQDNKWLHFEHRINKLEQVLNRHDNDVDAIKNAMMKHINSSLSSSTVVLLAAAPAQLNRHQKLLPPTNQCKSFQIDSIPQTDVQMLHAYETIIPFDNPDGGAWKQGWKIEIDDRDWNAHNKLNVFVVPHSHNDPGWVKTIDEYYLTQTKHILNNMLAKLPEDPRRKFIWAEISYFSMWWDELGADERDTVRTLLRDNQLEIVTGGWVMNDEANAHWLAILHQMTVGHQWLKLNLNYTPVSSWSIDPFGMSSTQPLLLKRMGLKHLLIQRVHYSVKKMLAGRKQLEFKWRQLWDGTGETDLFTHLMPFYSYDVPHTCGPDPKVCCQFDFKRLPGHGLHCPWKIPPQEITDRNIIQKADLLLDQYRKKSKLYKSNVLLVPLGDDFRYSHPTEWDVQFNNYQKLFDYMNSNVNLNVQAQFGTLTDYFNALAKEKQHNIDDYPILSGDFFTYADRDDHYWSGYYTSRPFYKRMDRVLLSYIRAAETIFTLAYLSEKPGYLWIIDSDQGFSRPLAEARKALALFQHHDGITGTARDNVVIDYGKKMLSAIMNCQTVIQQSVHILLSGLGADRPNEAKNIYYNIDDIRHAHDSISEHYQITIGSELPTKKIVIYNVLTLMREEVVTFYVSTPYLEVLHGATKERIRCQISPIFEYGSAMSPTKYQLSFVATVPPLSLITYTINALEAFQNPIETVHASINIYNQYDEVEPPKGPFKLDVSASSTEFTLQNKRIMASFNGLGLLKAIKIGAITVPVHLDFAQYDVRMPGETSGAYLFIPAGDARPILITNTVVNVIEGPIFSSVTVQLPYIHHTVTLYNSDGPDGFGLDFENIVDVRKTSNFELVMRLSTNINSSDQFFTDVNGYEIIRRKRLKKLPIQANYYPMPTTIFIEDQLSRLTVLSGSPLGASSLRTGQIEIMLDRRLNQDDNLGMGQGVLDNHPTKHLFRIVLERKKIATCQTTADGHPAGFQTASATIALDSLLNPFIRLLRNGDEDDFISHATYNYGGLRDQQQQQQSQSNNYGNIDISLVSFRPDIYVNGNYNRIGMVFHRQFVDRCFSCDGRFKISDGLVNITDFVPSQHNKRMFRGSLSFISQLDEIDLMDRQQYSICPMEFQAIIVHR